MLRVDFQGCDNALLVGPHGEIVMGPRADIDAFLANERPSDATRQGYLSKADRKRIIIALTMGDIF